MKFVSHDLAKAVEQTMLALANWNWDHPAVVEIKRFRAKRTSEQQAKLHAMLRDMARHNGISEEQMKIHAKFESYWPQEERVINGMPAFIALSESQLTVEQESEVISQLQAVGDTFGVEWSRV